MKNANHSLRRLVLSFLLFSFFCSDCFSEIVFKIKETELEQISQQTKTLTDIVNEQNKQLQGYQKLSAELRKEVESQKKKAQIYKGIAIGACVSSVLLGGALLVTCKN